MKQIGRFYNWLCHPPYEGVVWLAWLYVVFACLVRGNGPFVGNLAWFDDHVRMQQVLDWINGPSLLTGWHDHTFHRVNAPEGFHTIWARLVDVPIAAIIIPLQPFIGQYQAAMTAAILLPLLQVLFLFQVTAYLAEPLIGKQNARLAILFVLFSSCINAEYFTLAGFQLGAVGHHAWYVIFMMLLCGAAARLVSSDDKKHIYVAGLSIGALLAIGIEAIPLIGGLCATLGIVSWYFNHAELAKRATLFTLLGALIGLVLLPAYQPPDQLFSISFAEPSALGPLFVACAAFFFGIQFFVLQNWGKQKILCLFLFVTIATLLVGAIIYFIPQILDGPAAALSPEERATAALAHTEAMPLLRVAFTKLDGLRLVMPLVIAVLYGMYRLYRGLNRKDVTLYAIYLGFALVPFGMALALSRYYHHAMVMAAPWLTLAMLQAWQMLPKNKAYYLNGFLVFILLGPLWTLFFAAAMQDAPFGTSVLLFPSKRQEKNEFCDTKSISAFLNSHYSPDKTIMVPMYRSGQFLFNARMKIFFLANFPSNNKFIDVQTFYQTRDPNVARRIAFDHKIDLVTTCRLSPLIHSPEMMNSSLSAPASNFNQQMLNGVIPKWLEPVKVDVATPYLLFEVKR